MNKTVLLILTFVFAGLSMLQAQNVIDVTDSDITGDTYWTADNEYLMDGSVYVEDGETLTIEAGTVIRGKQTPTTGDQETALIVARGGKIFAEGTAENPIIFTADIDDVTDPEDLTFEDRGLWGGVIILGRSTNNIGGGTNFIEGLPPTDPRNQYGGDDENDNSGVFRYVSIRHGGALFGTDNEINGLTMGSVGRGTTIEYVEVFANQDDGFEWFGGTVDTRYLVAAFVGDDNFDYDEGFRGKGQFWFGIHGDDVAGSGGEHDGGTDPETGQPYAIPVIYNATYIGSGANSGVTSNNFSLNLRDNAGGKYYNSIFTDFAGVGVAIEDLGSGEDSRSRMDNGDLELANNIFFGFGNVNGETTADATDAFLQQYAADAFETDNFYSDPQLRGISRTDDSALDPRPQSGSPAWTNTRTDAPRDNFFMQADYIGAFGYENWAAGWSFISEAGYISDDLISKPAPTNVVDITDSDITGDTYWTADNEYLMDGSVYVEDGETLTIEAGTVIRGKQTPTTGDQETALIVARGGKIFAEGTAENPIIFTADIDDVTDPEDLTFEDRGLWGGVIILGRSTNNIGGGTNFIEGLPPTDPRNQYGGDDENDNSGVFRYVSIRHGGALFGTDNEINGLTMGSVGRGTTIEYVEVFANQDDGFEWFGGTVDTRYLVAAFVGDDNFDYDEGFRGKGQFWFGIHGDDVAGSGGEHDGGTDPETGQPYAIPVIYNATYIGSGANSGVTSNNFSLNLRDNAGGKYYNSIFTDFAGVGVAIEDLGSGEDSRSRMDNGDLELANNIFFGFGNVNGETTADATDAFLQQYAADAFETDNFYSDPQITSISRGDASSLDPRPASGSPAYTESNSVQPRDNFFYRANFIGAFNEANTWYDGWSFLSESGLAVSIEEPRTQTLPVDIALDQNYPNPFNPSTQISFTLPSSENVTLEIFEITGRKVATLINGVQPAGTNTVRFDASNLSSGMYIYRLQSSSISLTRKMMLIK
jgi:hypothetical protein